MFWVIIFLFVGCFSRHHDDDTKDYNNEYDDAFEDKNVTLRNTLRRSIELRALERKEEDAREQFGVGLTELLELKARDVEWCEFENSYLSRYSSGTNSYEDLASAQAACFARDDCGGITQERSNRYTLRVGPDVKDSTSGETSWTICERETGDQQYVCYEWTDDDKSWKSENSASSREMCERHEGYVWSRGDERKAPGCGGCWCCNPYETTSGTVENPEKDKKYYFSKTLEAGDFLEVRGTFSSYESQDFEVNIKDVNRDTLMDVRFLTGVWWRLRVLTNSAISGHRGEEVREDFPGLHFGEEFQITIVMMDDHFKIYVNGDLLNTFPYRRELNTAKSVTVEGGTEDLMSWKSIKMPGSEKSDVYTLSSTFNKAVEDLSKKLSSTLQGKNLAGVKKYVKSTDGTMALLQWQLLNKIKERGAVVDLSDETVDWILNNEEALETFMTSGDARWYDKALDIFREIIRQDSGVKNDPLKLRLAIATGLTFSYDIFTYQIWRKPIKGIEKYHAYVKWDQEGVLFEPFYSVSAWHLRYVVGSWQEIPELEWARDNIKEDCKTPDKAALAGPKMIEYIGTNKDGVSLLKDRYGFYYNKPITLKMILEVGGLCGPTTKFSVGMAQAFGIPALPILQPWHLAYMYYKTEGYWKVTYLYYSWDRSKAYTVPYTWNKHSLYFPLMDSAQKNQSEYRISEKMRIASKLANPADKFTILEDASKVCPENMDVWYDFGDALKEPDLDKISVQDTLLPILAQYRTDLKSKVSDIAPRKSITSECFNETKTELADEVDTKASCNEEKGSFEIDLGGPCTIIELRFNWYKESRAAKIKIYAVDEDGTYTKVKTEADERVEDDWSYISGWDMNTTKIKVKLYKGSIDKDGAYFVIRYFEILGLEHEVIEPVSTNKAVTSNPESSGSERLLDDDDATIWEGNADNSWFEIDLGKICVMDAIEFSWREGAAPETVKVSYQVGSGEETVLNEEGAVDKVNIVMGYATKIRVDLIGGNHALNGITAFGVPYSTVEILKMKVKLRENVFVIHEYKQIENDLLDAMEAIEYEN